MIRARLRLSSTRPLARHAALIGAGALLLSCSAGELKAGFEPEDASPVIGIAITPVADSVQPSGFLTFDALATHEDATVSSPSMMKWTATGGTITAAGVYTAGKTEGTFHVVGIHPGTSLADTALVKITTPPSPPPLGNTHEPGALTVLVNTPWDSLPPELSARDGAGWGFDFDTRLNASILADSSAPRSSANVLRMTFPAGFGGGSSPVVLDQHLPVSSTVYVSMWERRSAGWNDNGNAGTKRFFLYDADITTQSYTGINGGNLTAAYGTRGTTRYGPYDGVGSWAHYEFLWISNDPGVANGTFKMWKNGVLFFSLTHELFVPARHRKGFSWLALSPTFGGGYNPVPATQYIDVDDFYVSGAP